MKGWFWVAAVWVSVLLACGGLGPGDPTLDRVELPATGWGPSLRVQVNAVEISGAGAAGRVRVHAVFLNESHTTGKARPVSIDGVQLLVDGASVLPEQFSTAKVPHKDLGLLRSALEFGLASTPSALELIVESEGSAISVPLTLRPSVGADGTSRVAVTVRAAEGGGVEGAELRVQGGSATALEAVDGAWRVPVGSTVQVSAPRRTPVKRQVAEATQIGLYAQDVLENEEAALRTLAAHLGAEDLRSVAASLTTAEAALAYVRDRIALVPGTGWVRGASGTLRDRAGTPADRASLLGELLAAQGHEIRYACGELTAARWGLLAAAAPGPAWSTETRSYADSLNRALDRDTERVVDLLAEGGIEGLAPPELESTYCWVQREVGGSWIDLDPWPAGDGTPGIEATSYRDSLRGPGEWLVAFTLSAVGAAGTRKLTEAKVSVPDLADGGIQFLFRRSEDAVDRQASATGGLFGGGLGGLGGGTRGASTGHKLGLEVHTVRGKDARKSGNKVDVSGFDAIHARIAISRRKGTGTEWETEKTWYEGALDELEYLSLTVTHASGGRPDAASTLPLLSRSLDATDPGASVVGAGLQWTVHGMLRGLTGAEASGEPALSTSILAVTAGEVHQAVDLTVPPRRLSRGANSEDRLRSVIRAGLADVATERSMAGLVWEDKLDALSPLGETTWRVERRGDDAVLLGDGALSWVLDGDRFYDRGVGGLSGGESPILHDNSSKTTTAGATCLRRRVALTFLATLALGQTGALKFTENQLQQILDRLDGLQRSRAGTNLPPKNTRPPTWKKGNGTPRGSGPRGKGCF